MTAVRNKLICDIRRILEFRLRLILLLSLCVLCGVWSVFALRRVVIVWHFVDHPPFSMPILFLALLHISICVIYGAVFALAASFPWRGKQPLICSVLSFVFYIFLLALAFLAGVAVLAFLTYILSVICLIKALRGIGECRFLCVMLCIVLLCAGTYLGYVGVAFAVRI